MPEHMLRMVWQQLSLSILLIKYHIIAFLDYLFWKKVTEFLHQTLKLVHLLLN